MVKPQHRTSAYRRARIYWAGEVAASRGWCAQPDCVMTSRYIPPGAPWDLAHDDTGTRILGPAHRRCNRRDGALRRYKRTPRRWQL